MQQTFSGHLLKTEMMMNPGACFLWRRGEQIWEQIGL